MNASHPFFLELTTLIALRLEGRESPESAARLDELLIEHHAARELYLELADLDASLAWEVRPKYADLLELTRQTPPSAAPLDPSASSSLHVPVLSLASRTKTVLFKPVTWSILAVGLAFFIYIVVISSGIRRDKFHNESSGIDSFVAMISNSTDVKWSEKATVRSANLSVKAGEPLRIESGTMELELKAGTKLVIEGPADWSVDGNNRVLLRAGKLMARVPEQAIGFTVETPTAKVVDLGTEFGVEVSESGATEVQVIKGKIELHPVGRTSDPSRVQQPLTLSAGSAVRVEPAQAGGTPITRKIAATTNRFTNRSESNKSRRIYVSGALASSSHSDSEFSPNNLINGSGLNGERHSAKSQDTMWHSSFGKVKNEYVLFDMGTKCRLESMKVWNYNEHFMELYRFLGLKQADIYVSNGSRGTPLDHPEDWQLIAENVQFEPATGTPEYDAPRIIPLGNTTVRFVAMVIDEALGHDPRGPLVHPDVVGLAEVQFFGARVTTINGDINGGGGSTFTGVGAAGGGIWNSVNASGSSPATASGTNLVESNGTATSVDFTATGALNHGDIGTGDPNAINALLNDYLFTSDASDFTIGTFKFSDLEVGGVYDIYLYGTAGNHDQRSIFSIAGHGSQTESFGSSSAATTVVPVRDLNLTYVKFANVVADAKGEINGTWTNNPGFFAGPFNGFQLVSIKRP